MKQGVLVAIVLAGVFWLLWEPEAPRARCPRAIGPMLETDVWVCVDGGISQ